MIMKFKFSLSYCVRVFSRDELILLLVLVPELMAVILKVSLFVKSKRSVHFETGSYQFVLC